MVNAPPTLSIGLPVYNGEDFITQALDSFQNQTFQDFEIIISDNASTDRTAEICQQYINDDSRISYYRSDNNLGAAWNYNRTFDLATGKYFKWASHDDLCDSSYLEKCIDILEQDSSIVLCYTNTTVINPSGELTSNYTEDLHLQSPKASERYRKFHQRFFKKFKCNAVFGVMRRDVLQETELIGHYEASDIVLLAELSLRGKVYEIPEYLFFRRDHPKMSGRANPTAESIAAWFDPANTKKLITPMNRLLLEHVRAINRVPMSPLEKAKCFTSLAIFVRWKRRELTEETKQIVRFSAYRLSQQQIRSS
ncbi:MAG: glycosyltransferase [Phormidesmis sp.]